MFFPETSLGSGACPSTVHGTAASQICHCCNWRYPAHVCNSEGKPCAAMFPVSIRQTTHIGMLVSLHFWLALLWWPPMAARVWHWEGFKVLFWNSAVCQLRCHDCAAQDYFMFNFQCCCWIDLNAVWALHHANSSVNDVLWPWRCLPFFQIPFLIRRISRNNRLQSNCDPKS